MAINIGITITQQLHYIGKPLELYYLLGTITTYIYINTFL